MKTNEVNDTNEFLVRAMEENWIHARQSEDKRATTANVIVFITAAIQIALAFTGFTVKALPLTLSLILFGTYGAITTAKLYERSQFHIRRARKLRARLDELCPEAHIENLQSEAEQEHKKQYHHLMSLRLNVIWLTLHIVVAMLGVTYTIIIYLSR